MHTTSKDGAFKLPKAMNGGKAKNMLPKLGSSQENDSIANPVIPYQWDR